VSRVGDDAHQFMRDDDDTGHVGKDHVAGPYAYAIYIEVGLEIGGFHAARDADRAHALGEQRVVELAHFGEVTHRTVDDGRYSALGLSAARHQLTRARTFGTGGIHHQDAALDDGVDGTVI